MTHLLYDEQVCVPPPALVVPSLAAGDTFNGALPVIALDMMADWMTAGQRERSKRASVRVIEGEE